MTEFLRRLPGPVWTMAAWSFVILVDAVLLSIVDTSAASRDHDLVWNVVAGFNLVIIAVCLGLGPRTPTLFLRFVLFARIVLVVVVAGSVGFGSGVTFAIINAVIVVMYAGFWWRGRITYVYAGTASLSLLVIGLIAQGRDLLVESWFATSTLLFMMAFGLNYLVGRQESAARHDHLTGLANRLALESYVSLYPEPGRTQAPRALVVIDLDDFKALNDACGHSAGDELLRSIVDAWRTVLRADDLAFRIGGDEFLLVLPRTSTGDAGNLLDRLQEVSACRWSFGVTIWLEGETFDAAFARADRAMYQSKARARQIADRGDLP